MAIALDASTPALAWGTSPVTSASFTPPNNSLLVAVIIADWFSGTPTITCTSTSLTFTQRASYGSDSAGLVRIYTAPVGSNGGSARTVQTTTTLSSNTMGLKVFVLTGADNTNPVDNQFGGTGIGADPYSPNFTINSSNCFMCAGAVDWNGTGPPTSTDTYENASTNGTLSGIVTRKATLVNAGTVALNFNAVSTPLWSWAGISIKTASVTSGPNYAGAASGLAGGSGSWTSPSAATGAPDSVGTVWTAP